MKSRDHLQIPGSGFLGEADEAGAKRLPALAGWMRGFKKGCQVSGVEVEVSGFRFRVSGDELKVENYKCDMPPSAASLDCFAIVIWYLASKRANRLTGERANRYCVRRISP